MRTIPGEVTEIRYQRSGPLAGRYYHRFRPGVRMRANRDGSVTLTGPRKIHAVESEPGFWDKYGGKANPRPAPRTVRFGTGGGRRRRSRWVGGGAPFNWTPLFVLGMFWLWQASRPSGAGAAPGAVFDAAGNPLLPGVLPGDWSGADIIRSIQAGDALHYPPPGPAGADVLRSRPDEIPGGVSMIFDLTAPGAPADMEWY